MISEQRRLFAYAVGSALIVLTVSVVAGKFPYASLSIEDPGAVVRIGAPLLRLVVDAAATVCTGALVFAAFFTRRQERGLISPSAFAALRTAGRAALVWAVAALVLWPFDIAATAGLPLRRMLDVHGLAVATWTLPGPKAWLITAVLAAFLAVAARRTLHWRTTPVLSATAVLALLPVITAGHSASDTGHDIATAAIALHIPAAVIWLGTLIALIRARGLGDDRPAAFRRYARLSTVCWAVVVFSGVVDAAVLAPGTSWFTTWFGALLLVKVGVMVVLYGVRKKLATPGRLLIVEAAALAAAFGLSVGLTDLPAPKFLIDAVTGEQSLLGYDLAGPPTVVRLLVDWRFEPLFVPLGLALAAAYVIGLRRRRRPWPRSRTVAWLAGCAVLLAATSSGLGRYAPAMFSLEAVDHMLVGMLAPMLLALGAPLTLAAEALKPGDPPGPREWLRWAAGRRAFTRPVVVTLLFVAAPFLLYFTDAYDLTVRFHWAHLGMDLVFLVIGYLFAWTVVGADPTPEPAPSLIRLGLLLVAMPFDVVLAAAIAGSGHRIGDGPASANLYSALALPWVHSLAADQRLGAYLALALSEVIMFAMLIVVVLRWRPTAPDRDYETLTEMLQSQQRQNGLPAGSA
ncbi:cytochrome c oxidase assembly protein [Actinoplanes sp. NPDC051343]|uniref:cytochrome c oxidase assembly protein n=1 Tax=Actinoplanes sp. NPDC051343 TaxID=3363906 RepID=UPI0037AFC81B